MVYGYDVDHVDLELVVDFPGQAITGRGVLTVTVADSGLTELAVDLTDSLAVDSVTVNGTPRPFVHRTDQVIVTLASPPAVGSQHSVSVAYHGRPPQIGNKSMLFGDHGGTPLVYTLSTPYSNDVETVIPISHHWRPCKDVPDDKSTFSLTITVPDTMLACSNGILSSNVDNGDGTRTFVWDHAYPVAPYLIALGATDYVTIEETYTGTGGSADIQHFVYPELYSDALESFNITVSAMTYFASVFGEYPFLGEKYGMFSTPPGPAVEEQTIVAYPQGLITGDHTYDWVLVHELAHMWWGDCVTAEDWRHVWLNEGFASYAEALWQGHLGGNLAYRLAMLAMDNGPWSGTVYDPDWVWHPIVYEKGAWILHMLRWILGDTDFFQLLLDYRIAFEYGNATTEDLIAAAEAVYGDDLNWFFDPWVYQEGRPDYEYGWSTSGTGPYTVHLGVRQVQSPSYPIYKMPIRVRVQTTGGNQGFIVWDSLRTQTFDLEVANPPTGLVMDPADKILADFTEGPVGVSDPLSVRVPAWLGQNTPNPFGPLTRIRFGLSRTATVSLRVFDVRGRMVRTLDRGSRSAGEHTIVWDGTDDRGRAVASGVYFYQLVSPDGVLRRRMVLAR